MNSRPPIVFFAFNRPDHAIRALAALAQCRGAAESELLVYVDGPRSPDEQSLCEHVATIAGAAAGFKSVSVERSAVNKGLFRSITSGVETALSRFEAIIVVEDDLVVTPDFLDYMDDSLRRYAGTAQVGCIHGYALPLSGLPDFYFLRGGDCWGWATWRDRWTLFRPDAPALLLEMRRRALFRQFMRTHGAGSLSMLCRRARGQNQSWAILWHASLFLAGRLTLHPGSSFVQNIGNDGSGTHTIATARYASSARLAKGENDFPTLPAVHDAATARRVSAFMDGHDERSALGSVLIWLKRTRAVLRAHLTVLAARQDHASASRVSR